MDLYILRHAIAEPLSESNGWTDSKRALTPDGAEKMRRIAKGMQSLVLGFDRVLCSPFVRARQTAEIVGETFQPSPPVEIVPELASGIGLKTQIDALVPFQADHARLLVVGHEPDLSSMIATFISGDPSTAITMKKAGLCSLTVGTLRNGRCARLNWLLAPSQLKRL